MELILFLISLLALTGMIAAYFKHCRNVTLGSMHFVTAMLSFDMRGRGGDGSDKRAREDIDNSDNFVSQPEREKINANIIRRK